VKLFIRSEKPLLLQTLWPVWRELLAERGQAETRLDRQMAEQKWQWIQEQLKLYQEVPGDHGQEEELEALEALVWNQPAGLLVVHPLVLPASLPVRAWPLLEGMTVGQWTESESFSLPALVWLGASGAVYQPGPVGRVAQVAARDGVVLAVLEEDAAVSSVREQRDHSVEHIDEGMYLLQANLDDSSPEWLGYAMERLLQAGANDVTFTPITMKKSRPGTMVQVLCYASQLEICKHVLFSETTTFGVRYFPVMVHRLARRFASVQTPWGEVPVKAGYHDGKRVQVAPEYEVCARLAANAGVPLQRVYTAARLLAETAVPEQLDQGSRG